MVTCRRRFFSKFRSRNVSVHSDFDVCMTQQLLNDFRILAVGIQDGVERVAKRMPTERFVSLIFFAAGLM
jgi:SNF family Na+-dependent transporter